MRCEGRILGKPFMSELHQLEATYFAAMSMDASSLAAALSESARYPLMAVGSGGSLCAAHFACHLHQKFAGKLAKASTPMEMLSLLSGGGSRFTLMDSTVLCLSAGGSNTDINRACRAVIEAEPRHLLALCARNGSPLAKMCGKYDYVNMFEFGLSSGKDGFLATNSLLAFVVLLARSYSKLVDDTPALPSTLWELIGKYNDLDSALRDLRRRLRPSLERDHIVILHGLGTKAAAYDIESKFTEAALGSVQPSDYRNFAHGRHHWLAKRRDTSAVIVLAEDVDITLARRTVNLLPPSVPSVVLQFSADTTSNSIAAIVTGLFITAIAGEMKGVDPGRPSVPQFGRRLYHLGVGTFGRDRGREEAAVRRKGAECGRHSSELKKAHSVFTRSLCRAVFSGLVLDYDGTLCGPTNRFGTIGQQIAKELLRLLRSEIAVGIATERGKSVRKSLREALPKAVWERVTVGYYNGAECRLLSDDSAPDGTDKACPELEAAVRSLSSDSRLRSFATMTIRKKQISLEPEPVWQLDALWELVGRHISRLNGTGISAVESAHSIDVLAPGVSKRNVVDTVRVFRSEAKRASVLCIGDQGKWPGNDSDLLSEAHALSVNTVSSDLSTCWNIAPRGYRGPQAALFYLRCLVAQDGLLRFQLAQGRRT